MDETFFEKIKRIIGEGGKLIVINRKDLELDITKDFRIALIDYFAAEKTLHTMIEDKNDIIKVKDIDISILKDKVNKLTMNLNSVLKYKKIVDEISVKAHIEKNSPEAMLKAKLEAEGLGALKFEDEDD